jgi:hypothetical protein
MKFSKLALAISEANKPPEPDNYGWERIVADPEPDVDGC